MKLLSIFLLLSFGASAHALANMENDRKNTSPKKIYQVVDVMPSYPGGQQAMMAFIGETMIYPEEAKKKNIQGKVVLQFTVNEDGTVNDISVKEPVNSLIDAEAMRILKQFPKFKPGRKNGELVKVQYILPIEFKLDAPEPDGKG